MRTTDEIKKEANKEGTFFVFMKIIIELLSDIRELLLENKEVK